MEDSLRAVDPTSGLDAVFLVVLGVIAGTVSNFLLHEYKLYRSRKHDRRRIKLLREMLNNPGSNGWRKMDTMANVIGATRDETARLLIEVDARASESGKDVWAYIRKKPLPTESDPDC